MEMVNFKLEVGKPIGVIIIQILEVKVMCTFSIFNRSIHFIYGDDQKRDARHLMGVVSEVWRVESPEMLTMQNLPGVYDGVPCNRIFYSTKDPVFHKLEKLP